MRSIGIIGGAGPVASSFLYTTLLRVCQETFGANFYNDFPEILLYSYPFTYGDYAKNEKEIQKCFATLEQNGCMLTCLVSHSFHALVQEAPKSFVNLVDLCLEAIKPFSNVLILGAPKMAEMKLYPGLYPSDAEQKTINEIIRKIAQGKMTQKDSEFLATVCQAHQCDAALLACTELPMLNFTFPITAKGISVIDSITLLAETLIEKSQDKNCI